MFDFLNGRIVEVRPDCVVLELNNIGYQILTPNPYKFTENSNEKIYTYYHVRPEQISLFGFKTKLERDMFIKLLSVSGIGPKGALAILAAGEISLIVQAIEEENDTYLTKFPGIGRKTARQIILDLKGKFADLAIDINSSLFNQDLRTIADKNQELEDALEALRVLGYAEKEIKKIEKTLEKESLTTEVYIKRALQLLLGK
ncbi:MAG: Holliday junction branch migration protein RuvA [Bacillales bacterium]|nr:Holliday junction branch migration protein RuvA [Bacillales bacterium]